MENKENVKAISPLETFEYPAYMLLLNKIKEYINKELLAFKSYNEIIISKEKLNKINVRHPDLSKSIISMEDNRSILNQIINDYSEQGWDVQYYNLNCLIFSHKYKQIGE